MYRLEKFKYIPRDLYVILGFMRVLEKLDLGDEHVRSSVFKEMYRRLKERKKASVV